MRWFGWFRGPSGQGALTNVDQGEQLSAPISYTNAAKVSVTDERAMQVSTVFACTRLLVQSGSTLPLGFFKRTPEGREHLDPEHHLVRLLKYRPNNYMTAKEFRQSMFMSRVLWGNAYSHIEWSGNRPVALIPLKPEAMKVERVGNELVYEYSTNTGKQQFKQRDIFHLKGFGDGVMGVSALGYAREALGISIAADGSAAKSIGGHANAVLELDDVPTPAQKERLREMYGNGSVTTELANGLMITGAGMKYRSISIPPDDLQLLESRQWQVSELCRFFGVPAVMVDGGASTAAAWPASYEQQVLSFLTFGLKPYLEEWEDAAASALLSPAEQRTIYIEHNVDGLLRTDSTARANFYGQALQNGWATVNEVRMKENMPRSTDPGADQLHAQVNMAPLGQLGENNVTEQN